MTIQEDHHWFRPPFHIDPLLNSQMLKFAGLCDHFFTICRILEIRHEVDYIHRCALVCHDSLGWYYFGFPQRFPLTSGEMLNCDDQLSAKLSLLINDKQQSSETIYFTEGKAKKSSHPIFGDNAEVIYLGSIDTKDLRNKVPHYTLYVAAVIPGEKKTQKIINEIESIRNQIKNQQNEVSGIRMTPTRIDLLSKIADEILSQSAEQPFNWGEALKKIATKVSELLKVRICSIFLRESALNFPFFAIPNENLKAYAFSGYEENKIKKMNQNHRMTEALDPKKPSGITVSILCDRLSNSSQGKIVLLNHRIEIGGYNEGTTGDDGRPSRDNDLDTILQNEAILRGWTSGNSAKFEEFLVKIDRNEYDRIIEKFKYKEYEKYEQKVIKTDHDDHWRGLFDEGLSQNPCRALLGVPILLNGKPIGCIKVEAPDPEKRSSLYETDRFTFQDLILLDCIGKLISIAIQITHDKQNLACDEMTTSAECKIYTNPAIKKIFSPENKKFPTLPAKYQVLFIDVDNFKSINSDLGYEKANKVITEVGRNLYRAVKDDPNNESVFVARFGGDEFYIIFPLDHNGYLLNEQGKSINTDGVQVDETGKPLRTGKNQQSTAGQNKKLTEAENRAYKFRDNLRKRNEKLQDLIHSLSEQNDYHQKRSITLSIGSAIHKDLSEAISNASTVNRIAKWAGKNNIVFWETIEELMPSKRKSPIKIYKVLPPQHAIIDVGREHGVIDGLHFQVKHPPIGQDPNFDLVKAYVRVETASPRFSYVSIEQAYCDLAPDDDVFVRT